MLDRQFEVLYLVCGRHSALRVRRQGVFFSSVCGTRYKEGYDFPEGYSIEWTLLNGRLSYIGMYVMYLVAFSIPVPCHLTCLDSVFLLYRALLVRVLHVILDIAYFVFSSSLVGSCAVRTPPLRNGVG